jgi:hypothetical protein
MHGWRRLIVRESTVSQVLSWQTAPNLELVNLSIDKLPG